MRSVTRVTLATALAFACRAPEQAGTSRTEGGASGPLSDSEEVKALRAKADSGDAEAQYGLGAMYFNGSGVARDDTRAAEWFRKAAEQGRADAQYYYGEMLYQGRGVSRSYERAAGWYRKAAEQGYSIAQANLGTMSFDGQGVPKDVVEGYKWETLAADRAHGADQKRFAATARDIMKGRMNQVEVAEAEVRARAWVSARQALDDLVRETAMQCFLREAGRVPSSLTVDGRPPSARLFERLQSTLDLSRNPDPASGPHRPSIDIAGLTWRGEREALVHINTYTGPLNAYGAQYVVERNEAGAWSCRVIPGSRIVS